MLMNLKQIAGRLIKWMNEDRYMYAGTRPQLSSLRIGGCHFTFKTPSTPYAINAF